MPYVNGVQFPYSPEGIQQARAYAAQMQQQRMTAMPRPVRPQMPRPMPMRPMRPDLSMGRGRPLPLPGRGQIGLPPGWNESNPSQPRSPMGFKDGGKVQSKNWIKGAIKNPGALTRSAKAAGQSPMEYAREHKSDKGTTGKRARLALTLKGFRKGAD